MLELEFPVGVSAFICLTSLRKTEFTSTFSLHGRLITYSLGLCNS